MSKSGKAGKMTTMCCCSGVLGSLIAFGIAYSSGSDPGVLAECFGLGAAGGFVSGVVACTVYGVSLYCEERDVRKKEGTQQSVPLPIVVVTPDPAFRASEVSIPDKMSLLSPISEVGDNTPTPHSPTPRSPTESDNEHEPGGLRPAHFRYEDPEKVKSARI